MADKTTTGEYRTLSPHLVCRDAAAAIDFYKAAFGAEEIMRMPGQDGRLMHASLRIGDSVLMLVDEMPEWGMLGSIALKGSPVTVHLMVPNVDGVVTQAVSAGAKVTLPVADMFWGDRYGKVVDPFGHHWSIATRIREMTVDEMRKAGAEAMKKMSANCPEATAKNL